jgi:lipopolysaccharide transport protein LptA
MAAKRNSWASLLLAGLLAGGCGKPASEAPAPAPAPAAAAAPPVQSEAVFKQSRNYDAPYFRLKKMEISGKTDSSALAQNGLLIKDFKIETYQLVTRDPAHITNALEMTVTAPECLIDQNDASGSSAGPLTALAADGRLQIAGTGYLWQQKGTNAILTISNNVSTIIKNDLLAPNGAASASTQNGGRFIRIHADSFKFDRNANLITYRGHVHVEDEQLVLDCDVMNISRSAAGPIDSLVADGNIVIEDKVTHGRTTGEHAVYSTVGGDQLVTLTGNPYWHNGPQRATAQAFIFDKSRQTFRANGDAHVRLPANSMSSSGFMLAPQNNAASTAVSASNLVDVYAGAITMQLPVNTNGPIQSVLAETNVLITNAPDGSWAAGHRAFYNGLNGVLTLTGRAQWHSDRGIARAELLTFDRTNLTFAALTNAYLKFPVSSLGESPAFGNLTSRSDLTANRFLEVNSDAYDYSANALTFRQHVHAGLLEQDTPLGTLDSGMLTVGFHDTNVLRSIVANDDVHLRQPPTQTPDGKTVQSDVNCARIEIQMRPNGTLIDSANASGRVLASRTEKSANSPNPLHLTLAADELNALFMPDTNAIQTLTGTRNIVMTRDDEKATGDKVVYTATNDTAVLTGHPRFNSPHGDVTSEDAIVYNHGTGDITGRGSPHTEIEIPAGALSQSNLPSISGKNSQ